MTQLLVAVLYLFFTNVHQRTLAGIDNDCVDCSLILINCTCVAGVSTLRISTAFISSSPKISARLFTTRFSLDIWTMLKASGKLSQVSLL